MYTTPAWLKIKEGKIGFQGRRINLNSLAVKHSLEQINIWIRYLRFFVFHTWFIYLYPHLLMLCVSNCNIFCFAINADGSWHFIWSTYKSGLRCWLWGCKFWCISTITECDHHVYSSKRCSWKPDTICSWTWCSCNGCCFCYPSIAISKPGIWPDSLLKVSNKLDPWWYWFYPFWIKLVVSKFCNI